MCDSEHECMPEQVSNIDETGDPRVRLLSESNQPADLT